MSKKAKVVLYNPCPDPVLKSSELPLALLSVASIPVQQDYEVRIISHHSENELANKLIVKECVDALCFGVSSFTGNQIKDGLLVSQSVKRRIPTFRSYGVAGIPLFFQCTQLQIQT